MAQCQYASVCELDEDPSFALGGGEGPESIVARFVNAGGPNEYTHLQNSVGANPGNNFPDGVNGND